MANENGATHNEFPPLLNDTLLKAARGETTDYVPVWVMRQAGRYLPEFREMRKKHSFFEICQTPELACEVTLQPIRRFCLDGSIIFSDILVIPQALGMEVEMITGKGPHFPNPLDTPEDIAKLKTDVDVKKELGYVMDAITLTRHKLEGKVPLIGFSGAPWTLMAYMIEGGSSKTFSKSKKWLYCHEMESTRLLNSITNVIIDYLVAQVEAGAQMLQVFESHAEILTPKLFSLYSLPHLIDIAARVKERLGPEKAVPMIVFAKGAHYAMPHFTHSEYDVIALDWTMDVKEARVTAPGQTLMGNLDPCALYSSENDLKKAVKSMVRTFGTQRYIANLGHGIYPDIDPGRMATFVNSVHEYSRRMNSDGNLTP